MRHCTLAIASLVAAAATLGATSVNAQESYPHGFIRNVEPGVTLHRATEVTAEEALANLPFLPGDRVWTDAAGRAEFQFPEGTVVRLDARSKLDYSAHDESREQRVVLRLWSGSLILRTRPSESTVFEIETPGGLVAVADAGVVRIDVEGGETQLSVYEGEASLDTGRDLVKVARGERTWVRWGDAPAEPEPFDLYAMDEFAEWDIDLESREAYAAGNQRYLPEELAPYAPQFENHGTWVYHQPVGYVWQPRVAVTWSPYSNGRWVWTYYGWTWVPYESWGWAPHHYGRWGFSVSLGWYWWPGRTWGPAWVSWGVGGGYVGWCPLGWRNRPVVPWPHHRGYGARGGHRGYAVPRGSIGHERAWNVVRRGDLGHGNLARRRVGVGAAQGLRVAESMDQRPDRTAGALTRTAAIPSAAAARRRPSPSSGGAVAGSTARGRSRAATTGTSARGGVGWATNGLTGAAARARSRTVPSTRTPSSGSGLGTAARARPRAGAGGAASRSPRTLSPGRVRTEVRTGPSGNNRLDRSRSAAPRPTTSPRSRSNTSTRPRSTPSRSNTFSRSRSTTPRSSTAPRSRSSTSTRPRSTPSRSNTFSRSRSTAPRSSTVTRSRSSTSTRPRSTPSRSNTFSRSRSTAPRSSTVPRSRSSTSMRPRSTPSRSNTFSRSRSTAPRSSTVTRSRSSTSTRPRSTPSRSNTFSRSRSTAPRPSTAPRSRSTAPSRGMTSRPSSRPRSSGPSRGSVSRSSPSRSGGRSRSSSGNRSAARSRGGARRK